MEDGGTTTGLDLATLIIASVGVVLALSSLLWHILSWKLEGPRVKIRVLSVMPIPPRPMMLAIDVRNKGRGPTTITSGSGALRPQHHLAPANHAARSSSS